MTNKIEELGKILIEMDALTERMKELETAKSGLKFAIAVEQRELQMTQNAQISKMASVDDIDTMSKEELAKEIDNIEEIADDDDM